MAEQSIGELASNIIHKLEPKVKPMSQEILVPAPSAITEAHTAAVTPMAMIDRAISSGASVDTLERLMALHERWQANQAKVAFNNAMALAKSRIPKIVKSRKVDFSSAKGRTNYSYEDLSAIADVVDPILSEYGLSYRFRTETQGGIITVTCIISHRDGHSEENSLSAGSDQSGNKNSIQAVGSTQTYLSRYTLKAALGLSATNDDDGAKAGQEVAGTITEEQFKKLQDLLEAADADIVKFCQYFTIDALYDMPASKFAAATQMLNKRIAANAMNAERADA